MQPPKRSLRFLRWFCKPAYLDEIEGDLIEIFERDYATSPKAARRNFMFGVLRHLRPEFIRSFKPVSYITSSSMIQHFFLIAFRNFARYKSSFAINLVGLTVGLTSFLLIYMWVHDEWQMDKFNVNDERLFRVKRHTPGPGETIETHDSNSILMPIDMKAELPEVEYIIPFRSTPEATVAVTQDRVKASGAYAGKDFFRAFSFPIVAGNCNTPLDEKYAVAISEELAVKLFGTNKDIVGKTLNWDMQHFGGDRVITAVFQKPRNVSEKFDFITTYESFLEKNRMDVNWDSNPIIVDILLREGVDAGAFSETLNQWYRTKRPNDPQAVRNITFIQKYSDLYLHNPFENGKQSGGRIQYVILFTIVACFTLAIACINFMNLSTARAQRRWKEMGIKKAMGAERRSLMFQHLAESTIISLMALVISVLLVALLLPYFNFISGKQLLLSAEMRLLPMAFGFAVITGLISGSYPALYLSGIRVLETLKGKVASSISELLIRKGLVVFQFAISIMLIIGVVVVYRQMDFIQSKDLGYKRDNIILINKQGGLNANLDAFIEKVKTLPGVTAASSTGASLTQNEGGGWGFDWEGQLPGGGEINFNGATVNYGLIETLGVEMKEGRSFSKDQPDNNSQVILNEAAIRKMGMKDPIGKWFEQWGTKREIIGIMKDFHFQSMYSEINPLFFLVNGNYTGTIVVRIEGGMEREALSNIEKVYREFSPGLVFDFKFLDEEYQALYGAELRVSKLSEYFAGIAIVLSCLGLFGLAAYSTERRKKEISIRKVLGCGEWRIMRMLTFDFTSLVIVAAIVTIPLGYYFSAQWLDSFAYRTDLPWWLFAVAGLGTMLIAWITVGTQAIKGALTNPAENLRSE